jgi:hypothetical protein
VFHRRAFGALVGLLLLARAGPALSLEIVSQVGIEAVGGVGVENTLTGGFLNDLDFAWTHSYAPIAETILSATVRIDTIDADDGLLDLYAGTSEAGVLIGTAVGGDGGLPGPWRDLQSPPPDGAYDNLIPIGSEHFADLADGSFQIYADNRIVSGLPSLGAWGSNRAILTIVTTPEPATGLLVAGGILALALQRRGVRRSTA